NTPIERTWVDLGEQVVRAWRAFFGRLGRLHHLDAQNETHRWLLHWLFLDQIQQDCDTFVDVWNSHPIRTRGNKSPNVSGMVKHGVYTLNTHRFEFFDECEGFSLSEIEEYYGYPSSTKDEEPNNNTGLSGDEDEDRGNSSNGFQAVPFNQGSVQEVMEHDVDINIKHDSVDVPEGNCPFNQNDLADLERCMLEAGDVIPRGYGVRPEEWFEGNYPEVEFLPVGRARTNQPIHLTHSIWFPRAVRWAQACYLV
ncbi:hypothetical protein BJ165DRAFT_1321177, partial [Panaeolus papilionaceus]